MLTADLGRLVRAVEQNPTVRESGFLVSASVGAGKKGVAGGWVEGGVTVSPEDPKTGERQVNGYGTTGVNTAIGGVGYMVGKQHGWYGALNLPYVSCGHGNPIVGDTFSINIPLVGGASVSRKGGIGVAANFPLWLVRPGFSVYVFSPPLKVVTKPVFEVIDHVVEPVMAEVEREVAARTPKTHPSTIRAFALHPKTQTT
jgi:hypothetical protein